ncbi:Fic family protein [Pseudomonas sp. 148P]|uniref:Fic family protein n=1 Tax=Pseudomonas ulcerans TaxID=3115852 RepID=A0ABU7HNX9_9PSED|nr:MULTISPECIES: Fic family protein [unclassified Pseudomonas]MEE1920470.1 Fic family protein [Pseudomonas sp. 147P]MEE1933252.1 Fic family protein [Pseudomonas sp. 148P]
MAHIKKPKDYAEIFAHHSGEMLALIPRFSAVDAKGRYLHWHDFRHRVPAGINAEAAWGAVKLSRKLILKSIGLDAENGQPFQYCLPDYAQKVIHDIEHINARLGLGVSNTSTSNESNLFLVESLMMEEAISSAQLEGAATTRKVAKEMLEKEREPVNDDERMIFNNFMLMKLAKHSQEMPLSIELIRRFHAEATRNIQEEHACPGEVRRANDIYLRGRDEEIAHQPPDADVLLERLENLCEFANQKHDGHDGRAFIHPAVKAIILHFMIGYEHPFNDGNGRTARCIFYWYLLKHGYWAFEYISISALLKQAPVQYGESYLFTETDDFDLTYFICYQLKIIERAMEDFLAYIEQKRKAFYYVMELLAESGFNKDLNFRQIHLLKKVLRSPGRLFIAKEVKNDFDVSEGTARADLEKLVKLKLLAKTKEGKTHCYVARGDAAAQIRKK